ncbi:MAG: hypothetical protein ACNA8K_03890 [Cyclonatronaceae bacterium]
MSTLKIRLAVESDNDSILALAARCPQEGMITFFPSRTPRFNTLHRLLDPGSWHYVAVKGGQVVGLVGVVHFRVRILDRICRIGFMMDLRLDKAYRSGTTAFRLVSKAVDHVLESDIDLVIGNFLKQNRRPMVFASGRAGIPASLFLGDNRIFNLIPVRKMSTGGRFSIRKATSADIPEIVDIQSRYALNYRIAPVPEEDRLRYLLNNVEGFSLDRILLACENGRIRAVTALWDEHFYKSYQVLKLSPGIEVVNNLIKALSFVLPMPHPIQLNEPLRQLSMVMYAHDNCPEALNTLFRFTNNTYRGSGYTLITLYAQERDPVFRLLKGFPGVSVKSEMYLFASDAALYEKIREDPRGDLLDLTLTL